MIATDSLATVLNQIADPVGAKAAATFYGMPFITDDQLLNAYRGSWLARKVVNIPAYDSVRKWREWQADVKLVGPIEAEENRLMLPQRLLAAQIKARLFGGGAIYIGTGDTNLMEPLEVERIKKGGVKYLTALSRVQMTAGDIERDPTVEFAGRPGKYTVNSIDIHPSRFALFYGAPHPEEQHNFGVTSGWSDSVLVAMLDAIKHADSTPANVASLIFEANIDVFGIVGLMDSLGTQAYESRILTRMALVNANKGINRSILKDAEETFERKPASFAGLSELIITFIQLAGGAADIPTTRLLGTSPGGLNATGESDLRNYYDGIAAQQRLEITPSIYRLDEALLRSALGTRPADVHYIWSSLWQIDDKTRADIGKTTAETVASLSTTGLFPAEALASVAANSFVEHSVFPGLETAIADAPPIDFNAVDDPEPDPADPLRTPIGDARPMTLYIRRDVKNVAAISTWARSQGMPAVQDGLHVTIAYSKTPVDWIKVGEAWQAELKIAAGGPRLMERFGSAIVLQFAASELEWRHQRVLDVGGSSDYDEYQPHITIMWEMPGLSVDLESIEPYRGEIVLGPEIFEEIDPEWKAK